MADTTYISPLGYLALIGWIPLVIVIFMTMRPQRAASIAVIGAWLLLPPYAISLAGLPDYTKITAAAVGSLLATLFLVPDRLLSFRARWHDLPMFLWSICGIASSLHNDLGIYDGLSDALTSSLRWWLPYLLGRIYFSDPKSLRDFTIAMIVAALLCVLPCVYEMRMSPQILRICYGVARMFDKRMGGWRPQLFFWTGLELGMWMTAATLTAWWMWYSGAVKKIGHYPLGSVVLPILFVTTILCRSTGAAFLLFVGMFLLWASTRFRTRALLLAIALFAPLYVGVRTTKIWTGESAVDLARATVGEERAHSLQYRFNCERLLSARAMEKPLFGWGGWGRSALYFGASETEATPYGDHYHIVPPDGLWIGTLGSKGFVGLGLFYTAFMMPVFLFLRRFPARMWKDRDLAAGALAATLLSVYMIDCLMNAFPNMIYITLAGGLASLEPRHLLARSGSPRGAAGQFDGSAAQYRPAAVATAAIGRDPGRFALAQRCCALGRAYRRDGHPVEAEAAWRQAIDILSALIAAEPGSDELRRQWCDCANDLAWLRVNHPDLSLRDPAWAVATVRLAVEQYPEAAAYWNTLGVALYRAGDDRAAVEALERSRDLSGGTAFDEVFLAMAYARLGNAEAARQGLARAVLLAERDYPGHPELLAFCDEGYALIGGGVPAASG